MAGRYLYCLFERSSNNILDFLLKGSKPKKKLGGYPDCSVTNWDNLQQVVSGELALADLLSTSTNIVLSQNQDSQPIQNKLPAEETNSINEVSIDFGNADSFNLEVTTTSQKAKRIEGRLIKDAKSKARSILSAPKSPLKKKARKPKKPSQVYVVDGNFPHIETGDKFIKTEIKKDGGKVMKSLSKNVSKYHPVSTDFSLSLSLSLS